MSAKKRRDRSGEEKKKIATLSKKKKVGEKETKPGETAEEETWDLEI